MIRGFHPRAPAKGTIPYGNLMVILQKDTCRLASRRLAAERNEFAAQVDPPHRAPNPNPSQMEYPRWNATFAAVNTRGAWDRSAQCPRPRLHQRTLLRREPVEPRRLAAEPFRQLRQAQPALLIPFRNSSDTKFSHTPTPGTAPKHVGSASFCPSINGRGLCSPFRYRRWRAAPKE